MPRFFVLTFGCRCNQADSAAIRESLYRRSFSESESYRDADYIIVNTCTVTHRSDRQARQTIRRLHRENPSAQVIATGCYAERDPETLACLPGVCLVLGNADRERLVDLIGNCQKPSQGKIFHAPLDAGQDCLLPSMIHTGGKTRPLVKLQDGCDARCSYCIVPKVRGPGRSARPEDILAEIQSLVGHGFQEIVLTGIHLGAYGRKTKGDVQPARMSHQISAAAADPGMSAALRSVGFLDAPSSTTAESSLRTPCSHARLPRLAAKPGETCRLVDLLRRIVEIPGLGRIRLSSIEPMDFDRAIIKLTAENPVFARHFHIPLQSGSDRILRLMHRPYTATRFCELLRYIHNELPDAGLGTDLLVGFPGETEQDFAETCALIEDSPLAYLHVFPFSPREGTEACLLPDPVPSQVIKRRMAKALEISRSKNLAFRRRFLDQVLPAITLAKEEDLGVSVVLADNYIHACIPGLSIPPNRLVEIRIDDVRPDATYASII
jgi:threonylcarbamoyladenosine tRNA methylthiotransferase MtaB